jgi:hypothetical protein
MFPSAEAMRPLGVDGRCGHSVIARQPPVHFGDELVVVGAPLHAPPPDKSFVPEDVAADG